MVRAHSCHLWQNRRRLFSRVRYDPPRRPLLQTQRLYPEADGLPMGVTDLHIAPILDLRFVLMRYFRAAPQVNIATNLLVYYAAGAPREYVAPDVFRECFLNQFAAIFNMRRMLAR
jgi:hypothetical protein